MIAWRRINRHLHCSVSGRYQLRQAIRIEAGDVTHGRWIIFANRLSGWVPIGDAATIGEAQRVVDRDLWHGPMTVGADGVR